jgi:hypothetical protein
MRVHPKASGPAAWSLFLLFIDLFFPEHHAMKAYWGSEIIAPLILDLGIRWR